MGALPFLVLPRPVAVPRKTLGSGGRTYRKPTAQQQRDRLDAQFREIVGSFREIQPTIAGLEPEQAIVFETLTASVDQVAKAVARIPGLEWLAERELPESEPEFGFADLKKPEATVPRRLYALMTNQQAIEQLIRLWDRWAANPAARAQQNFGPFKSLFQVLRDVRRWGPEDRVAETGILELWREAVAIDAMIPFEVEFWYRSDARRRQQAYDDVAELVRAAGGRCLDEAVIPEIFYHGALVEMPGAAVQEFLAAVETRRYTRLLLSNGVMFFRPRAQSAFGLSATPAEPFYVAARVGQRPAPNGDPILAALDGLPVENHASLTGRIVLDDPDNHAERYQPREQQHGTAMASLLIHGDLNVDGPSLRQPIYLRPIFEPEAVRREREVTPRGRLLVDLIHRAIRRLFEPDGGQPAAAPSVRIINLALGDPDRPFDRELSPLARLLDWLAWRYRILVVISAGNCLRQITLENPQWQQLGDIELAAQVLRAMQREAYQRRLLSPAEAVNCITVAAIHADACQVYDPAGRVDLMSWSVAEPH